DYRASNAVNEDQKRGETAGNTSSQNMNVLSIEDKRLALSALDIEIIATPDSIRIKGAIPVDTNQEDQEKFTTTGRT
ncbi:hypothetical protein ACFLXN_02915, partial [Chloroflexota bacterium]